MFKKFLIKQMGKFYKNSITSCKFEKHKTFMVLTTEPNIILFNLNLKIHVLTKPKNVWYETYTSNDGSTQTPY